MADYLYQTLIQNIIKICGLKNRKLEIVEEPNDVIRKPERLNGTHLPRPSSTQRI